MLPLLRAIGRSELGASDYARVEAILAATPEAAAPDVFVEQVGTAGFLPFAYRHLVVRAPFSIREPLETAIRDAFTRHATTRFVMARRLRELLGVLAAADIDARPYKGPELAERLYGNFAMRQFGDLDIIVDPRQVGDAFRALSDAGLRPLDRHAPQWDTFMRGHRLHDYPMRDAATGTLIELHWVLAGYLDNVDGGVEWFLDGADDAEFLGAKVKTLPAEQLLLALAIHGTRHMWRRLAWLADLAELIRASPDIDWNIVRRRAQRIGMHTALPIAVDLAHHWFGSPRPAWIDGDRAKAAPMFAVVDRQLSMTTRSDADLTDWFQWRWSCAPSLYMRARLLWRVATTPSERDVSFKRTPAAGRWRHVLRRARRLLGAAMAERRGGRRRT
jgi:hypothetical protein